MTRSEQVRKGYRTMAEYALEQLREEIILGEIEPGAPLRLDELARSLGMSISPIREAVRQLEALGLAVHIPHQGAKVVALDVEELRDLFSVRLVVESHAVRLAAAQFTEEDAARARAHLDDALAAKAEGDTRRALHAHADFHFAVYEAARSPWLVRLIRPAWDSSERFRPVHFSRGELQDRHRALDEELLAACVRLDVERAARAFHDHLALADEYYAPELGGRSIFKT
ncbi:MAG TPA: GntR family transcriptional regulator [Gaiellaceae bacterium]|nr:GntR family transcriptional regulator [Gaiellaceae bacterium]